MDLHLENLMLKRQILELQSRLLQVEWEKIDSEIKKLAPPETVQG